MQRLTRRQQAILTFIRGWIAGHGYPPTFRDIGQQFGIASSNGVACHVKALERKGCIQRDSKVARAIRILRQDGTVVSPFELADERPVFGLVRPLEESA